MTSATKERVAGQISLGVRAVKFDSIMPRRGEPRAVIHALDGRELIALSADGSRVEVTFGGGAVRASVDRRGRARQILEAP